MFNSQYELQRDADVTLDSIENPKINHRRDGTHFCSVLFIQQHSALYTITQLGVGLKNYYFPIQIDFSLSNVISIHYS